MLRYGHMHHLNEINFWIQSKLLDHDITQMLNDAMTMTQTLKYSLKIKSSTYMSLGMRLVQVQEIV